MKKILIVVDMQNDFIDGVLGTKEAEGIVDKVVEKIKQYNQNGDPVFATMDTHKSNYLTTNEGKHLPVKHCIANSKGWRLHEKIAGLNYEACIKDRFGQIFLRQYIWKVDDHKIVDNYEIELCGVCTDICVITNALLLKTWFPESTIKVDASCCAGTTPEMHQKALDVMKSCQVEVVNNG